jgi:hypothetical protein
MGDKACEQFHNPCIGANYRQAGDAAQVEGQLKSSGDSPRSQGMRIDRLDVQRGGAKSAAPAIHVEPIRPRVLALRSTRLIFGRVGFFL